MEIKRIIIIDEKVMDKLTDMVDCYLREADEYDVEHKDAMAVIDTLVRTNKGALFGAFNKDCLIGYMALETCMNLGRLVTVLHQMYVNQEHEEMESFDALLKVGSEWAKETKANSIYFPVRRYSGMFKRLSFKGWNVDSTVLKLNLVQGGNHASNSKTDN